MPTKKTMRIPETPERIEFWRAKAKTKRFKSLAQYILYLLNQDNKSEADKIKKLPELKSWGRYAQSNNPKPCPECDGTNIVYNRASGDGPFDECRDCGWKE